MTRLHDQSTQDSPDAEREIFDRVIAGETDALANLYRIYHPRLFRFAFRLTNSFGAAEELVNDVMLAVWNGASSFRNGSKISTWIYGIAYRKCMSHLRRKRITTVPEVSVEHLADETGYSIEEREWIRQGLDGLPDEQRICMLLVFYVGCTYAEIAEITNCKAETVKTRMFYARRKLRVTMPELANPVL